MNSDRLVRSSVLAARLASYAACGFAVAVLAGLPASTMLGSHFTVILLGTDGGSDIAARTSGLRWLLVLGVMMSFAIFALLRAIGQIVATVSAGDPFIAANAARLRTIGWSLFGLQLLDLPAAVIAQRFPLGAAAPDAGLSPAGWLAVLMAFVLSRVFVAGAAMRDDLDGTI